MKKLVISLCLSIGFLSIVSAHFDFGDYNALNEIGLNSAEIIRLRGFLAQEYSVTTSDGYILTLVRATNPLINDGKAGLSNKSVVLFIHGINTDSKCFLVNSIGAKPNDYSHHNISSDNDLNQLLANDGSINSLPFLLLNFGHEVWLLNRRGSPQSLGRTNGRNATIEQFDGDIASASRIVFNGISRMSRAGTNSTEMYWSFTNIFAELAQSATSAINGDYWSYSMDEQAKYDLPKVIDHIREATGDRKVSIVGHSAGGAITLFALAEHPKLAQKLGQIVLWAPAVNLGHTKGEKMRYSWPPYIITNYVGSMPPLYASSLIQIAVASYCATALQRRTTCRSFFSSMYGSESEHQNFLPGFVFAYYTGSSVGELAQLTQTSLYEGRQHYFDHGSSVKNMKAYGSPHPPAYDFTKIEAETLSLYVGATDNLVSEDDVRSVHESLSIKADLQVVAADDGLFNHMSFVVNDNAGKLINIPTLRKLELSS